MARTHCALASAASAVIAVALLLCSGSASFVSSTLPKLASNGTNSTAAWGTSGDAWRPLGGTASPSPPWFGLGAPPSSELVMPRPKGIQMTPTGFEDADGTLAAVRWWASTDGGRREPSLQVQDQVATQLRHLATQSLAQSVCIAVSSLLLLSISFVTSAPLSALCIVHFLHVCILAGCILAGCIMTVYILTGCIMTGCILAGCIFGWLYIWLAVYWLAVY